MRTRGLLVVLTIAAAVILAVSVVKVGKKSALEVTVDKYEQAKVALTRANLESLAREVLAFAAEAEGLPVSIQELRRLHPAAAGLTDGWGRAFRYERLSDSSFRLRSAGPDGAFDTDDDIVRDD